MDNVINLNDYKKKQAKKDFTKNKLNDESFEDRIERIQNNLNKINALMAELKKKSK